MCNLYLYIIISHCNSDFSLLKAAETLYSVIQSQNSSESDVEVLLQALQNLSSSITFQYNAFKTHVFWKTDKWYTKLFCEWWESTLHDLQTQDKLKNNLKWEFTTQSINYWNLFEQVMTIQSEKSDLQCKLCQAIISHLNIKNTNFSTMKKHLHSDCCKVSSKWKHSQSTLNELLQLKVNLFFSNIIFKCYSCALSFQKLPYYQ